MRLGCCLPGGSFMPEGVAEVSVSAARRILDGAALVREVGYDYSEITVGMLLEPDDAEFEALVAAHARGELEIPVCNSFIPGSLAICAGAREDALFAHVAKTMERMQALGAHTVVLGSGRARSVPEGMEPAAARANFARFLAFCSETGERCGVTVAIEPLNRRETNLVNTVSEGAELVRSLALPRVRLLADAFHMACEGEPPETAAREADLLIHTHVAEAPRRVAPGTDGGDFIPAFLAGLSRAGYAGGVTVECGFADFNADIRRAYAYLHPLLSEVPGHA